MSHIKFFKDINKNSIDQAGGKGASLGEMLNAGIPVPPGFVVLASAFERFLIETNLQEEIKTRLSNLNVEDTNSVTKTSAIIRDMIHDHDMPGDLAEEILGAFDVLCGEYSPLPAQAGPAPLSRREEDNCFVAVRSSATAEDSNVASWAGELETYLNTGRENVVERVKNCWSSLFTPRAIFYRHEQKLSDHYVSVAVVIQKMIQSEISGIAFTVHPVTEDYNQMIIEAGYGLGEAIVSGQITPDSYVIAKDEMKILDVNVGVQTRKLTKRLKDLKIKRLRNNDDSVNGWIELGENEGSKQKLNDKQIIELAGLCQKIEKHYGFPCDIEWAHEGGAFYITQSRPITTLKVK